MTGALRAGLHRAAGAAADNATAAGYLSAWRTVRLLPEPVARRLFDRIADRIHRAQGSGVRRLSANLARVRPDLDPAALDALTRDAVRSYLRYWCESFRLPSWPMPDLVRRTRTIDEHFLRDAYAQGGGAVVALPHMGNWDWAGAWACATGMPVVTVAERLKPARLYDRFVAYRRSLGMEILPLTGEEPAFARLRQWVSAGGLACLLADRDLSRTSIEVTLCGHRARMPRGPALLARDTGAPLIPVTLAYAGDDLEITFHRPVPAAPGRDGIATMTQGVADAFTEGLRAHPQDWHMMQRVFADDLARGRD